jgi:excisionase family DNA binding protein
MDKLMSVKQAAERLSCSEDAVWKWLKEGRLQRFKVGRLTRVRAEEVQALAAPVPRQPAA